MNGEDGGCKYLINEPGRLDCGAVLQPGSPYCAHHHGVCYLAVGSRKEAHKLRSFEQLARYTGDQNRRSPLSS